MTIHCNTATPPPALVQRVQDARHIAVLTGAGMSAESGIPTFRDPLTGLWQRFDPQALATPEAFRHQPDLVWAWYTWRRRIVRAAQPNAGHRALAMLSAQGKAVTVITQNVDDLHERAGSPLVLHLHGSLLTARCFDCGQPCPWPDDAADALSEPTATIAPPRCAHCGGAARPDVVWFGEALPQAAWRHAQRRLHQAELLLVVGTSGQVYPAAGLAQEARRHGCTVAVINPDPAASSEADWHWEVSAATGLPALVAALERPAPASDAG